MSLANAQQNRTDDAEAAIRVFIRVAIGRRWISGPVSRIQLLITAPNCAKIPITVCNGSGYFSREWGT